MSDDREAIRELLDTWWDATRSGDAETVLDLLADDAVFLTPGMEPFGKAEFAEATRGRDAKVDGSSEIVELEVAGDWAWMRTNIHVSMTPPDAEAQTRSGTTLTILRRGADGRWRLARDANLLA